MTGRRKIQIRQLFALLIAFQAVGILDTVYDHFILHSDYATVNEKLYSFPVHVMFSMVAALMGGLIGGSIIIFWVNEKFINKSYGKTILSVVVVYLLITLSLVVVLGLIYVPYYTGAHFGDENFKQAFTNYIFNDFQAKNILLWSFVTALAQFFLQMDRKFGHGVLWQIILGRYHSPREELRIFMFADLNSSTSIAESMGDKEYHLLLRDFFADITNAIIDNDGNIYQYVGDQVIVSWKMNSKDGGCRCIQCFFDMKKSINDKKEIYIKNYGLFPVFKAGIHMGKVCAGEIGIIKRDITYSGDVLNTTSRLQDKCGELKLELIVSDELLTNIPLQPGFISRQIGCIQLKGKSKVVGLNAISESQV